MKRLLVGLFKVALRLYIPHESVIIEEWVPPAMTRQKRPKMT